MQQPPADVVPAAQPAPPAAPPPPAPPAASAPVAVQVPGLEPIAFDQLPKNAQELQGLRERREILRDQLERASNRRDELVNQLNGEEGQERLSAEARVGVQQRLQVLDERILQLERDQAATERLLSNAPPAVLAEVRQNERDQSNRVDEDEAVGVAFSTFGLGIVLTLVVSRVRAAMRRRRGGAATTAAAAAADDPRIDRLAHAVEAIAEEVERIGEGQRFVTQLLASQQRETAALSGRSDRP
ncbi:hypothetical protein [Roseisolibacter sp. H3M3-2]|uniref:hypothetical protein n=1 Tax=Roseisolibacter sp. H3M3-2 TaxID=3031323 RepID=UPI0023DC469E|nr:hypothetical protein [Roseisolibacter sp. H3M3-2]MDF1506046.1 hypothetical protein [Roseisolibacter sp. H3M3-2]